MRYLKGIRKRYIATVAGVMLCFAAAGIVWAVSGDPGSDSDPLVTQSYVDSKIAELSAKVDKLESDVAKLSTNAADTSNTDNTGDLSKKVSDLNVKLNDLSARYDGLKNMITGWEAQKNSLQKQIDDLKKTAASGAAGADKFVVVNMDAWRTLTTGQSTEIIVRSGTAKAIAGKGGGIADLSSGKDLLTGAVIPLNHHLIAPVSDGRGLVTRTKTVLLIKGAYTIK